MWPALRENRGYNDYGDALIRIREERTKRNLSLEPEWQKKRKDVERDALLVIDTLKKESAGQPIKTCDNCWSCLYSRCVNDKRGMFDDSEGRAMLCTLTPNTVYKADSYSEVDQSEFRCVKRYSSRFPPALGELEPPKWCPLFLVSEK